MDDLLRIGLCNAVAAVILAVIAFTVGRVARRPALTHALWLLVLVKLVTPPIRCIEIAWPMPEPAEARVEETKPAAIQEPEPVAEVVEAVDDVADIAPIQEPAVDSPVAIAAPPNVEPTEPISWSLVAGITWLTGSVSWLMLAGLRTYRFHVLLCHARPAPRELRAETKRWARALGMRRAPEVWLVPGRVSPLLWWLGGRPHLYLPADLWPILDGDQRTSLLVHELAHLRRGDQWVRALEMLATSLFWWHPILWLARHELREAEEQCCDAWVVWALPGAGRLYALALVETLDFLSETRTPLPSAASGLGHVRDLRRRLSMIMRGKTPRQLGWLGFVAVIGAAILLLPLVPTLAQDSPRSPDEQEARVQRQQAEAALQRAEAQLQEARAHAERARMQAQNAERNARQQPDRAGGGDNPPRAYIVIIQDGQGREVRRIQARAGQTIRVPGGDQPQPRDDNQPMERGRRFGAEAGPSPNQRGGGIPRAGMAPDRMTGPGGGMQPPGGGGPGGPPGGGPGMPGGPGPGRAGGGGGFGGGPGMPASGGGPDQERRLQNIERRLEEIMRTMERMMQDQNRRQPGPGGARPQDNPSPRRESRIEEEDIKARPTIRSRTPVTGNPAPPDEPRADRPPGLTPRAGLPETPPVAPVRTTPPADLVPGEVPAPPKPERPVPR